MFRRFLESPWPYFLGAGILLLVAVATQFELRLPARPPGQPQDIASLRERQDLNVIFILVDTLRADRLGSYGYARNTSGNLDVLANQGILFRNVVAQSSWTKASMASLWTGTHPSNNGVVRFSHVIPDAAVLPAERFREAGYRTVGVWRNGWVAPNFGFAQGFDIYVTPKAGQERRRLQSQHPSGRVLEGTDEDNVTAALDFLDSFGRERFFLYLHFMDLHQYVYDEAAAIFGNSYSDVYDQALHWTDRLIGHLVGRIGERGLLDRTVIVIASDHGEAFQEHGFEGHARNLYDEVVNVPWIIALPFRLESGIVVEPRVSNVDIWPTMLDLVGLPPLVNADGRSLMPLVLAAAGVGEADESLVRPTVAELDRRWGDRDGSDPLVSVTDGDLRVMWSVQNPDRARLFDLATDPREQVNLYDPEDAESQRMAGMARRHIEQARNPWDSQLEEVELDDLRLNQLRALGYVIR